MSCKPPHDFEQPFAATVMRATESASSPDAAVSIDVQSLLDERYALHDSTLHQPAGSGMWAGNFRGSGHGHGTDYDDLRHYSPGDELRHIDWNASARTNTLHTRLYREEREHRVTLIVDLRSSMFTGSKALRSVKASLLTARLLWQAIDGGSRANVLIISDAGLYASEYGNGHRVAINACGLLARCFNRANLAIDTHGRCGSALGDTTVYEQEPQTSTAGLAHFPSSADANTSNPAAPDDVLIPLSLQSSVNTVAGVSCEQVAHWLITQRQLHGTVVWISAFDQLGDGFDETMNSLSQATRQGAIYIHDDMLENGLPAGRYGYRYGDTRNRTSRSVTLNRTQCKRLKNNLMQQKQDKIALFSDMQVPLLSTDSDTTSIVSALRQIGYLP